MTAQIEDRITFKYKKYDMVALQNELPFHPQDLNLTPVAFSSDCWRGFFCHYSVTTKGLVLKDLYIHLEEDYPCINGVEAVCSYADMRVYKNINLPVAYSGGMVIATDFMQEYYVHMGFQAPVSYETVYEVIFEQGKVVQSIDHSNKMREIREAHEFVNLLPTGLMGISEAFALDYGAKFSY